MTNDQGPMTNQCPSPKHLFWDFGHWDLVGHLGLAIHAITMQLNGYSILHPLSGSSFLAHDSSRRKVVLKLLPPDCLLEGQLNPSIADRLRRVREIAMTDVAN